VTTWATQAQVEALTGVAVTVAQLAKAQAVIDIYSNRTIEVSGGISRRDENWLRQAVAWQAAWEVGQVAAEQRMAVRSVNQDQVAADYVAEYALTLAPLAARALKNLSWKTSRTIALNGGELRFRPASIDYTQEWTDDLQVWEPMHLPGGGG
jgi:hypothetical protein